MAQSVYDDEDTKKDVGTNKKSPFSKEFANQSNSSSNTGVGENKGFYNPSTGSGNNLLNQAENSSNNTLGAGYTGSGNKSNASPTGRLKVFVSNNKGKSLAGGGAGASAVILIFLAFSGLVTYELTHMEQVLTKYEDKVVQKTVDKSASYMFQKIFDRWKGNQPAAMQSEAAGESATGETLSSEVDSFNLADPKIQADLANGGLKVETTPTPSGNAVTGITDSSGNDVSNSLSSDALSVDEQVGLPTYEVGIEEQYRPDMVADAGATFDVLTDTPTDKVNDTMKSAVENGASGEQISEAAQEVEGQQPSQNSGASAAQEFSTESSDAGVVGGELKQIQTEMSRGVPRVKLFKMLQIVSHLTRYF